MEDINVIGTALIDTHIKRILDVNVHDAVRQALLMGSDVFVRARQTFYSYIAEEATVNPSLTPPTV